MLLLSQRNTIGWKRWGPSIMGAEHEKITCTHGQDKSRKTSFTTSYGGRAGRPFSQNRGVHPNREGTRCMCLLSSDDEAMSNSDFANRACRSQNKSRMNGSKSFEDWTNRAAKRNNQKWGALTQGPTQGSDGNCVREDRGRLWTITTRRSQVGGKKQKQIRKEA